MSRLDKIVITVFILVMTSLFLFAACAPPPQYADQTQEIQQGYALTIGTPNSYYHAEVIEVSDRVQVLKFVDPSNRATCYLAIQSISCVK